MDVDKGLNHMIEITWMDYEMPKLLDPRYIPLDVKTVLDVGCGKGTLGAVLRNYRKIERMDGIEGFKPYLKFAARHYDEVMLWDLNRGLPPDIGRYDLVLVVGVLEHLEKEKAIALLKDCERIGKRVLVSTPGYMAIQPIIDGNEYQEHRCRISTWDLRRRRYKVRGVGHLQLFGHVLPIQVDYLEKFPRVCQTILAVKERSRIR